MQRRERRVSEEASRVCSSHGGSVVHGLVCTPIWCTNSPSAPTSPLHSFSPLFLHHPPVVMPQDPPSVSPSQHSRTYLLILCLLSPISLLLRTLEAHPPSTSVPHPTHITVNNHFHLPDLQAPSEVEQGSSRVHLTTSTSTSTSTSTTSVVTVTVTYTITAPSYDRPAASAPPVVVRTSTPPILESRPSAPSPASSASDLPRHDLTVGRVAQHPQAPRFATANLQSTPSALIPSTVNATYPTVSDEVLAARDEAYIRAGDMWYDAMTCPEVPGVIANTTATVGASTIPVAPLRLRISSWHRGFAFQQRRPYVDASRCRYSLPHRP